jgi:Na+/H+-dicarboxylate symporter
MKIPKLQLYTKILIGLILGIIVGISVGGMSV